MTRKVARRCSWLPVIPSSQIELCFSARVDQWSHSKWSKSAGRGAYGSDFTVSNALWESDFQITTKSPARCPLFTCDEVYWMNFIASESVDIVRESLFILIRYRYKTHVKQHTKWFPTAGDITDGRPSFIVQPPPGSCTNCPLLHLSAPNFMIFRNDLILNKLPNISALLISPLSNPPLPRCTLHREAPARSAAARRAHWPLLPEG